MRNDGKYLEKSLEKELKKIQLTAFHYMRLQDSTAARNLIASTPADFICSYMSKVCFIECKSRAGKTFRLPKVDQLPDLKRWSMAGVGGYVLVHWHEVEKFCVVDVKDLEFGVPSWSLKDFTKYDTLEEVVKAFLEEMGV